MFDEDLDQMFDVGDFAVAAIWSAGGVVSLIFDNGYTDATYGSMDVAGTNPRASAPAASLPDVAVGQTFTIDGAVFTIRTVEPDSTGRYIRMRLSG